MLCTLALCLFMLPCVLNTFPHMPHWVFPQWTLVWSSSAFLV